MELSTKSRYGLRALAHLAYRGFAPTQTIAAEQSVPPRYLEEIIAALRAAGFVEGKRGPRGGYRLSRPAEEIQVDGVIACLGRDAATVEQPSDEVIALVEARVSRTLAGALGGLTLQQLVDAAADERRRGATDYVI